MPYFFHVNAEQFRILRPATEDEVFWYNNLADDLREYSRNIDRFERVEENYNTLLQSMDCRGKSILKAEKVIKNAVANFLYSFNECIDHWKTFLARSYGEDSDYFIRYKKLTSEAYDTYDEYRITYGLRNYQHVDWVVQRVSTGAEGSAKIYTNRDVVIRDGGLNSTQKDALKRQPEWIELLPVFAVAKKQLESINIKLLFYTVTSGIEERAIKALVFKEALGVGTGALLIGDVADETGAVITLDEKGIAALAESGRKLSFRYDKEVPWGVCQLLKHFQGTDYKNC